MTRKDKIQHLLITHLLQNGQITLVLPTGLVLEIGMIQEDAIGRRTVVEDYCYVSAEQEDRKVSIDSFNLALSFSPENGRILCEDNIEDELGNPITMLNVI